MENNSVAKECGARCRRFRMAQNMSQQDLADKMYTTAQNISKYEKDGISNIDTIMKLSEVLGHNLLSSEVDEEGVIGEIGKEILRLLIEKLGFMNVADMVVPEYMYGMSLDRFSNEVFKLERIGMCVREQFIDWVDQERDVLFITTKGVISYKNQINNSYTSEEIEEYLPDVITYEELVEEEASYQECIDVNPAEKLIRKLKVYGGFRANYIQYLHKNYEYGMEAQSKVMDERLIPGENAYFDILYRMMFNFSDTILYNIYLRAIDEDCPDENEEYNRLLDKIEKLQGNRKDWEPWRQVDGVTMTARELLRKKMPLLAKVGDKNDICPDYERYFSMEIDESLAEENYELYCTQRELGQLINWKNCCEFILNDLDDQFEDLLEEHQRLDPTKWFSYEDYKNFIEENYRLPETQHQEEVAAQLAKINELCPETLDYFVFPDEWHENGLAELVMSKYKVVSKRGDSNNN